LTVRLIEAALAKQTPVSHQLNSIVNWR
jgi:hypothetical protein